MPPPGQHDEVAAGRVLYTIPGSREPAEPLRPLPPAAELLVNGIRDRSASDLLPPIAAAGPANTLVPAGELGGDGDAELISRMLTDPRFAPVLGLVERLAAWCQDASGRYPGVLAPGVLTITNAGLFGRLVAEVLVACATGPPQRAGRLADTRAEQTAAFLERFLQRLGDDLGGATWPAGDRFHGPVVGLATQTEETHNGGQRVLRVDLRGGGRVAYKPRPASGERFLLAPQDSLFALLNQLEPATGAIELPTLPVWTADQPGPHRFYEYTWQEWVEPPAQQQVLRAEGESQLLATVLPQAAADRFWHRTGALTAVLYLAGVIDLHSDNILLGAGPGGEPMLYPVDLEVYFSPVSQLAHTGLVPDPVINPHHHCGLETEVRWCALEGPTVCWHRRGDGGLELRWRWRPWCRTENRAAVVDDQGRAGYGSYLPAMLRGMLDAWTLFVRHQGIILEFLAEHRDRHVVRVVPRPTAEYGQFLQAQEPPPRAFEVAELSQLERFDVPYFFRAASGGPILITPPAPAPLEPTELATADNDWWPPEPSVIEPDDLQLGHLGVLLRDAVDHVFDDLPDRQTQPPEHGVRTHLMAPGEGQVGFELPELGRRLTYVWSGQHVKVRIDPLSAPAPAPPSQVPAERIRSRLLRFEEADSALRRAAVADGFSDPATVAKLAELTSAELAWLRQVINEHGWPSRKLVGHRAAQVASRLVQHADGELAFRKHCLELVREAAEQGTMPHREVAYLTDALRLAEGLPQLYGTKFRRIGDRFEPYPMEEPQSVDTRRAGLGMEPLEQYAKQIHANYGQLPHREQVVTDQQH